MHEGSTDAAIAARRPERNTGWAMSQENVEVVRRMYEAFHAGDTDGALACFDPDVVVDFSRRADGRVGHGREYLNQIIASWLGAWEEWREEIDEIRDLGKPGVRRRHAARPG